MKYNILLNFLPITSSDFTFQIFCRKVEHQEKSWKETIFRYNLKKDTEEYESYWVSFENFENSESINVSANENFELTKQYLLKLLQSNLKQHGLNIHSKSNRFNQKRIYIILEKIQDGNKKIIGDKTIWLEPYYLKTKGQFGFLIDYSFLKSKNYPFNREVQKFSLSLNSDYRSNVNFNIDKYQFIQQFFKNHFSKIENLCDDFSIKKQFQSIEADTLTIKKYIFSNNEFDNSQFNGVMNYGPYETVNNSPYYFYIFKQEHRNQSTDLLNALNGKTYNTFRGLSTFKLDKQSKANTTGIIINDYSSKEIDRVITEIKKQNNENPILISISPEVEERFYYELKNRCLQENIPSQTVHLETINNYNKLKWSVGSIALQIFSKLSGVPWIVEPSHENCLIVGYGQANRYNDNNGKLERYFSYSVLVDSSGKFIEIKQLGDEANKKQFLEQVTNNISELVENHSEYKKIVFHIPQKIKREDIIEIQNTLDSINSELELSIIKINDDPKYLGFNKQENTLVPYESSFMKISDKEYLLWPEGLNFHNKRAIKRYGNPLHISFYYSNRKEDFNNHNKYLQDILNLSGANYRGFNAKSLPVSVYYPKLIADFTKHFKELDLQLSTNDTKKPWFL